ncbi:hypothetical protein CsatA_028042 [Cannabis sativa]
MEYLTRRLQLVANQSNFKYHPMCKSLKIISLCFADDLMLFCKGNLNSLQVLKSILDEFSASSGLAIKANKSQLYFGGVKEEEKQVMLREMSLLEGLFLLNIVGAPQQLDEHLHLAAYSITREIEKLFRGFLWDWNGHRSKLHVASWEKVYLPKNYGGLRFKDRVKWNQVVLAKYIWAISSKTIAGAAVDRLNSKLLYNSKLLQFEYEISNNVWSSYNMPKHRFIFWQVTNNQLLTRDKFAQFKITLDSILCPVCGAKAETNDHLFFAYCLSQQVLT